MEGDDFFQTFLPALLGGLAARSEATSGMRLTFGSCLVQFLGAQVQRSLRLFFYFYFFTSEIFCHVLIKKLMFLFVIVLLAPLCAS